MTPLGPAKPSLTGFLEALRTSGGLRLEYEIHTRESDAGSGLPALTEVLLSGPDTPLLLERNGELLHAIESLAAAMLRLEPEQAEQLSFDANGFKANRREAVAKAASDAVATVVATGKPFLFPPMNSRERRMLHLALVPSGLATASSGLGPRRFVVLYPAGQTPEPERFEPSQRHAPPFRNQGGYKSRNAPRTAFPNSGDRVSSKVFPASSSPVQDPESRGNHVNPAVPLSDDPAATQSRLDSIRRAFRKR